MTTWGRCDFKDLQRLQKRLQEMQKYDLQRFCAAVAKELAARLLRKVIKRTPVGQYPKDSGKVGGTLRRGWTADTEEEAQSGGNKNAAAYAKSLPVEVSGDTYTIEIINPVHYASFVEYGHRTRGGKGWVEGRFMLTKSEMELESQLPKIIEKKLMKHLGDIFK